MFEHQENIGFLLNKATRLIKWDFDKKLKHFGITTPQWSVIIDLAIHAKLEDDSKLSPAAIAERLNIDRPTLSGIIDRLAKKGLLITEENIKDRRFQVVKLTPLSEKLLPELEALSNQVLIRAMTGIQDKEIILLKIALNKIIDNLSN